MANLSELQNILKQELIKKTAEEWLHIFDGKGLPCGPINSITEMFEDPQTIARNMIIDLKNSKARSFRAIGMPVKFSDTRVEDTKESPTFGQHTIEILKRNDFTEGECAVLLKNKVVI